MKIWCGGRRKKLVKIYGERNTGTNYLSQLIRLNLEVEELPGIVPNYIMDIQRLLLGEEVVRDIYFTITCRYNLGWKHTCVKSDEVIKTYGVAKKHNLSFVTVTKNPYSWLLSLYRRPYHQYWREKPNFEKFLRTPWKTVGRDGVRKMLPSPVELWNIKNSSYLKLENSFPCLNLRYEDVLYDPESAIQLIAETFFYEMRSARFQNLESSTKEGDKDYGFYLDYYLTEEWKNELSPRAISIINERLSSDLMNFFGYYLLCP